MLYQQYRRDGAHSNSIIEVVFMALPELSEGQEMKEYHHTNGVKMKRKKNSVVEGATNKIKVNLRRLRNTIQNSIEDVAN